MKKLFIVFLSIAIGLAFTIASDAKQKKAKYEVIEVTNGGTITGKALFAGAAVPKDETLTLTSETELCGKTLPARKYLINANKKIENAVIYIADITAGKKVPDDPVVVDNVMCAFEPHVSVGVKGNKTVVTNSDPVFHNTHSYIDARTIYNIGLPEKGSKVEKTFKKDGLMSIKCDSHPWMLAYVYVFAHPYAAVTNEKGEFSISDIPPGSYEVKAWHEGLGEISLGKVTVDAGKTVMVNAEFK